MHSANTDPVSLQPSSVAVKKLVRRRSQPTNAVARWVDALNRQLWNVQPSNVVPFVVASVRSTSANTQSTKRTAPISSAYQSSSRKVRPSAPVSNTSLTHLTLGGSRGGAGRMRERANRIG